MIASNAERHHWLINPDYFKHASSELFSPMYWKQNEGLIGEEKGRGTTWFLKHQNKELVLRHYYRGGLIGKLNNDRYLYTGQDKTRSIHEFRILAQLHSMGLPVPEPVAAQSERHGLWYRSDIILKRVEGAKDLISVLQASQAPSFFEELGRVIARFHKQGVYHADLNIKNILLDEQQSFWLIDFDRARLNVQPQSKLQARSMKRLYRSVRKERERHQITFTEENWQALIHAYEQTLDQSPKLN